MKDLVYYTVGFSPAYIGVLELSVRSLRISGWKGDVAVLCDASFLDECKRRIGSDVHYFTFPNSKTPEEASINKLRIFELPTIHSYNRVFFLDCDILVHMNLSVLFDRITRPGILYVYTENRLQTSHTNILYGLQDYTEDELAFFSANSVHVLNAGCFAFLRTDAMKAHFSAILEMIRTHVGPFFYEQSFMNAYFNRNGQTDRTLLVDSNYVFPPQEGKPYPNTLLHFAGNPGNGNTKYRRMKLYMWAYL